MRFPTAPFTLLAATCMLSTACSRGMPQNTGRTDGTPPAGVPSPNVPAQPVRPPSESVPELHAAAVTDADITVDGRSDEAAWARCGSTGALVSPMNGAPEPGSRVQANARLCWSNTHLYFSATVKDAAPAAPFGREQVDRHLWEQSSAVELMLQPGNPGDNKVYYELQVDTAGAVWDTWFEDYNRPQGVGADGQRTYGHQEWNAQLQRAATVDAAAGQYTVELALPWASVASARTPVPPRAGDVWRLNVYAFRDGQRDSLAWSPLLGRGNFHFAPRFGRLVFDGPR
jgi:hypothetical protein